MGRQHTAEENPRVSVIYLAGGHPASSANFPYHAGNTTGSCLVPQIPTPTGKGRKGPRAHFVPSSSFYESLAKGGWVIHPNHFPRGPWRQGWGWKCNMRWRTDSSHIHPSDWETKSSCMFEAPSKYVSSMTMEQMKLSLGKRQGFQPWREPLGSWYSCTLTTLRMVPLKEYLKTWPIVPYSQGKLSSVKRTDWGKNP